MKFYLGVWRARSEEAVDRRASLGCGRHVLLPASCHNGQMGGGNTRQESSGSSGILLGGEIWRCVVKYVLGVGGTRCIRVISRVALSKLMQALISKIQADI